VRAEEARATGDQHAHARRVASLEGAVSALQPPG
jgi:hypothetical protein